MELSNVILVSLILMVTLLFFIPRLVLAKSFELDKERRSDLEVDDLIPGIRAYGIPRSKLEAEPEVDLRVLFESRFGEDEADQPGPGDPRYKPSIEAYKPKLSGNIERVTLSRGSRSIGD